jgi:soluble lytic murein transglycosylase-like protein
MGANFFERLKPGSQRRLIPVLLLPILISIPSQSHGTMYGFLDAKGVCHFRDIPDSGQKTQIIAGGGGALPAPHPATHKNKINHHYDSYIREAAIKSQIDPLLVKAMINVESNYNQNAISRKGAQGIMQIMPNTAKELRLDDPFDPEQNIIAGTKYLKQQLNSFGDIRLGLAAYNAGPGRVSPQGMLVYIPETQSYVAKVLQEYRRLISDKKE